MKSGIRIVLVLVVIVSAMAAASALRWHRDRERVEVAVTLVSEWPMGGARTPLCQLLRRVHALSQKADVDWDGVPIDRKLGVVRLVARLSGPDGDVLRYAFDVDIASPELRAANPRARWLLDAWPPQSLPSEF